MFAGPPDEVGVPGLITLLADTGGAMARACLLVIARLAPRAEDRDVAALEAQRLSGRLPAWLEQLDDLRITDVRQLTDGLEDAHLVLLQLEWPATEPVSLVALVDRNRGGGVTRASLLPSTVDELVRAISDGPSDVEIRSWSPSLAEIRAVLEAALDPIGLAPASGWSTTAEALSRRVIEWILAALPAGGRPPRRPEWSEADLVELRERFFASPWGCPMDDTVRRRLLDGLLAIASDGDDPLRWSAARVGWFPLEDLADDPWPDPDDLRRVPDLLRALIGFAHTERGIDHRHTEAAIDEVERASGRFRAAIRALEPSPDHSWSWDDHELRTLAERVGSWATLAALDVEPLPDEPFRWDGIAGDAWSAVGDVLAIVDDLCDGFFDGELRTAARRLLGTIARRRPVVIRRGRPDATAAGVVWLVGTANDAFRHHGVPHKAVKAHLGLRSALSSRAESLHQVLIPARRAGVDVLGDAAFLTSYGRAQAIVERDRALVLRPSAREAVGW